MSATKSASRHDAAITDVVKQLTDYASGARYPGAKNPAQPSRNGAMMLTIAKRLTPEDMRNVASYVQGLR